MPDKLGYLDEVKYEVNSPTPFSFCWKNSLKEEHTLVRCKVLVVSFFLQGRCIGTRVFGSLGDSSYCHLVQINGNLRALYSK